MVKRGFRSPRTTPQRPMSWTTPWSSSVTRCPANVGTRMASTALGVTMRLVPPLLMAKAARCLRRPGHQSLSSFLNVIRISKPLHLSGMLALDYPLLPASERANAQASRRLSPATRNMKHYRDPFLHLHSHCQDLWTSRDRRNVSDPIWGWFFLTYRDTRRLYKQPIWAAKSVHDY